jgi:hypothetical protein
MAFVETFMVKTLARARLFALAATLAVTSACGADATTAMLADSGSGPISIRVHNSGALTFTDVSIVVADDVAPITLSELRPGQTTDYVARPRAHENPLVTLKIDGKEFASHPVEGFTGFNPALADGAYTINMQQVVVETTTVLYVWVSKG